MKTLVVIASLLILSGCASFSSTIEDMFTGDVAKFLTEINQEGTAVSNNVLDSAAQGIDAYCDNTPEFIRTWARTEIGSRRPRYETPDFCVPVVAE